MGFHDGCFRCRCTDVSYVDARFEPRQRDALLQEVKTHLPAFLSPAATEQVDPVGDIQDLLNLDRRDLQKVIATHLALSDPIRRLIAQLPMGLRRPIVESYRRQESSRVIRGAVDWAATMRLRSATGDDRTQFIVRPAHRVLEVPENQALAWLLHHLDSRLRRAAPTTAETEEASWFAEIVRQRAALAQALRRTWISDIEPRYPDGPTLSRLRSSRRAFYAVTVTDAIQLMRRYDEPSGQDITELLCGRWFRPSRDWQLFELVVALRLARAFAEVASGKRRTRLLAGGGRRPFARYQLAEGDEIALWYQAWPDDLGRSLHADTVEAQRILGAGALRPDIVVTRRGSSPATLIIEVKATASGSYMSEGLAQLLGYLHDRPDAGMPVRGWLTAPSSSSFEEGSFDAGLLVVAADRLAAGAVGQLVA